MECSICGGIVAQLDVIVADLDGGSIHVPEHVNLALMPDPMLSRMRHCLNLVSGWQVKR